MKTIILLKLIIGFIFSSQALAKNNEVPEGALRIGIYRASTGSGYIRKADCDGSIVSWLYLTTDQKLEELDQQEYGLEYRCSEVYILYGKMIAKRFSQGNSHHYSLGVEFYCKQRTYSEKLALINLKGCEERPSPECIDIAESLDKVKLTKYIEIKKPKSCAGSSFSSNSYDIGGDIEKGIKALRNLL